MIENNRFTAEYQHPYIRNRSGRCMNSESVKKSFASKLCLEIIQFFNKQNVDISTNKLIDFSSRQDGRGFSDSVRPTLESAAALSLLRGLTQYLY